MSKIQEALDRLRTSNSTEEDLATDVNATSEIDTQIRRVIERIRADNELILDWQRLRERGFVAEESASAEISQQFRRIKRPLLRQIFEAYPVGPTSMGRVILVASALGGDGKSFTSLNLALAMAIEPELQVVLVDGDAPKQGLTDAFELSDAPGLLDAAADRSIDPASVLYQTDQDGLFFLPAGNRRSNSPEVLGSSRCETFLKKMVSDSGPCVVVIDTPPVLLANEARALSSAADHSLFVVRAGETNTKALESALESFGVKENLFMLLNQSTSMHTEDRRYEYGYGYSAASEDSATRGG